MTEQDLAWFAGVLDVSGKIYMRTDQSGYEHPILDVRAKEEIVRCFAEAFGGKINTYQSDGKRLTYWRMVCSRATVVLAQVRPFMRIRGERVDVLLAWRPKTRPWAEGRSERKSKPAIPRYILQATANRWAALMHGDVYDHVERDDFHERAQ